MTDREQARRFGIPMARVTLEISQVAHYVRGLREVGDWSTAAAAGLGGIGGRLRGGESADSEHGDPV